LKTNNPLSVFYQKGTSPDEVPFFIAHLNSMAYICTLNHYIILYHGTK